MDLTENVSIRRAGKTDALKLRQIGAATFTETFIAYNTPSDMEAYLTEYLLDNALVYIPNS